MKKFMIFMLVGMLLLTGCSSADNTEISSNEDTKSAVSSTQSTDKIDVLNNAKESDKFKVEIIAENLDIVSVCGQFAKGLFVVVNDEDFYAYMDETGKICGDGFVYLEANSFDEDSGLAAVMLKDGTKAYINTSFEVVIKEKDLNTRGIKYERIAFDDFEDGYAAVTLITEEGKEYGGIINTKGELTAGFVNKNYTNNGGGLFTKYAGDDESSLSCDIVDAFGKVIKHFENEWVISINGFVTYTIRNANGNYEFGLMDENYNKITDAIYIDDEFSHTYSDVLFARRISDKKGVFINSKGEEMFEIKDVERASVFDSIVAISKQDYYYIYNRESKQISSQGYYEIGYVGENTCVVCYDYKQPDDGSDYKYYELLVDFDGNIIYKPDESHDFVYCGNDYYIVGKSNVNLSNYSLIKVVKK